MNESPRPANTLGKTSLFLSIPAISLLFCTGLCAGVAKQQGWLAQAGALFFVFAATFAFVGLLAGFIGFVGIFVRPRLTAVVGCLLGLGTVFLFSVILNAVK